MSPETIQLLSSAPPKRELGKPFAFPSANECHAAICAMETELGIAHGPLIKNIVTASARFRQLESIIAERDAEAAAAAAAVVTQNSPKEPATATERCLAHIAAKSSSAGPVATVQASEKITTTARCLAAVAARKNLAPA